MTAETGQPLALPPGASDPASFAYLNTLSGWPSIKPEWLAGLVVDPERRTLELAAVPGPGLAVGPSLPAGDPSSTGLAGIAVDCECNVYLADAAASLIWRVDACDGR